MELSEIITKKHLERTGISFKSTPDLESYFEAQRNKKAKELEAANAATQEKPAAQPDKPQVQGEEKEADADPNKNNPPAKDAAEESK